jgi:hypothetical protein
MRAVLGAEAEMNTVERSMDCSMQKDGRRGATVCCNVYISLGGFVAPKH